MKENRREINNWKEIRKANNGERSEEKEERITKKLEEAMKDKNVR